MSGLRLGRVLGVLRGRDVPALVVVVVVLGRRGELRNIATLVMRQGNIGGTLLPVGLKVGWALKRSVCKDTNNQLCRA